MRLRRLMAVSGGLVALAIVTGPAGSDGGQNDAKSPSGSAATGQAIAQQPAPAKDAQKKSSAAEKDPAGMAELLRQLPKKFARFVAGDPVKSQVTLHVEGESAAKTWPVTPDAEVKRHGWWGRLEQFQPGERVWVWFDMDRKKQPTAVLMLADEISEQDLHGQPPALDAVDVPNRTITLKPAKGEKRTLKLADSVSVRKAGDDFEFTAAANGGQDAKPEATARVQVGHAAYVQSAGDSALAILDAEGLKAARHRQDLWLRERWRRQGLAGMVSFLHRLGGEMDVVLDHEAIRWGRYLKAGDEVTLIAPSTPATSTPAAGSSRGADEAIRGSVKQVTPWRERTTVRLVVSGFDQGLLTVGQRLQVKLPEPPATVQDCDLPTDIGRPRSKAERLDWFLSSVYCTCRIGGDGCTGMFYTLASCSAHNCGMPRKMRGDIEKLIDKGLSDEQIYAELRKTHGPLLGQPHLVP